MRKLHDIPTPEPRAPVTYRFEFAGEHFRFDGLRTLLGKADYPKAGDKNAGLAPVSELEREAARAVLAGLTLQHLYDHPLTRDGRLDEVMRVNYDIDMASFALLAPLRLGELKNRLLASDGGGVLALGRALTGVMAAALAKLCDTHELIAIAAKVEVASVARTHLGGRARLASRLQPNHPTDDPDGISALIYAGLALGAGDALIGVNPARDTVANATRLYQLLDRVRRATGAPTQICVLAHIKTSLACLAAGAPVEILFQSLAGTEATNLTEFDISVATLDAAHDEIHAKSPLLADNPEARCLYFETGQGSEFSYAKHDGMDMTTCEALCYGLARRYRPFMVNNVTGFIGPETHADNFEMIIANLQDHFMGKLLGLPMGMAPCYTLHSNITLEGQQMAAQLLTAAGANFFMDVHLNTDRMLAYFDTSAHDDQTLREIHRKSTTPEFERWALERGIFARAGDGRITRGPRYGDPTVLVDAREFARLAANTPVMPPLTLAGPRPSDAVTRSLRLDQAFAREAIYRELDVPEFARRHACRVLHTRAGNKLDYLNQPELGAWLNPLSARTLTAEHTDVQIVISDGLSANAVDANCAPLLEVLGDGFEAHGLKAGQTILVPFGRVKLAEDIATRLACEIVIYLIGERPGGTAAATRSLSCYYLYQLTDPGAQSAAASFSGNPGIRFEYSVLSNIYDQGINPIEAGSVIVAQVLRMRRARAAGNRLLAEADS